MEQGYLCIQQHQAGVQLVACTPHVAQLPPVLLRQVHAPILLHLFNSLAMSHTFRAQHIQLADTCPDHRDPYAACMMQQ